MLNLALCLGAQPAGRFGPRERDDLAALFDRHAAWMSELKQRLLDQIERDVAG
jgi:hypothetical protein